jgi:hypothetical protein
MHTKRDAKTNLNILASYFSDHEIVFMQWISTNILFTINSRRIAKLLYTGKFYLGYI